jgi:hypothetical protein
MKGARIFVGVIFTALGLSFLASTYLLVTEFKGVELATMLAAHSNLYVFFPLFGVLALVAFFLPAVIFTHLYWFHIKFGRIRFLIGILAAIAATYGADRYLDTSPRALWEVSPQAMAADKSEPVPCTGATCERLSIPNVLTTLRDNAQKRVGLSKFARSCGSDALLEAREEMKFERYCFPAGKNLDGNACCQVQQAFSNRVDALHANPATRSNIAVYDRIFMPMKIFFVVVIVAIGLLLAMWRDRVDAHYGRYVPAMERGLIIGGLAMLLWPAMDYGYLTTTNVIFGHLGDGPQFRLSLVIAPWTLLLLFYFLRRLGEQGEMVGQISGVVAAAVAVLRYEQLNDWANRLLGIGMPPVMLGILVGLAVVGLFALFAPWHIAPGMPGETKPPAAS